MTDVATIAGVTVAAAAGSIVRFRLSPYGWRATLAVNVAGSFLLGILLGAGPSDSVATVAGVGFCGSLTTFGTFALEARTGPRRTRLLVVSTNLLGCLGAATLGYAIA
jgi:CrcB protein